MEYNSFIDQSKNIYNTQGKIVNKNCHQIFSDNFKYYLKNNNNVNEKPNYPTYINKCYPPICNPIKWDISEKIIDVQYINNNVCNSCQNNFTYRIG